MPCLESGRCGESLMVGQWPQSEYIARMHHACTLMRPRALAHAHARKHVHAHANAQTHIEAERERERRRCRR
eukprot:15436752-Alexandrium_andersonii.AAC.1